MSSSIVNEQQIVEALHRLPAERWGDVLNYIEALRFQNESEKTPAAASDLLLERTWTATELLKLPREQRNAILAAQMALAEEEYRTNPDLTGLAAFGDKDLYVNSSGTEAQ
jgi:hypothetical protein